MQTISVSVERLHPDDGDYGAGIAIVRLNGLLIAKLLTSEGIEFVIPEPKITTTYKL